MPLHAGQISWQKLLELDIAEMGFHITAPEPEGKDAENRIKNF